MKKAVISFVLIFALLFTMLPATVFSVTDKNAEGQVDSQSQQNAQTTESDVSLDSQNTLGSIISNMGTPTIEKSDNSKSSDYYISDVAIDGDTADVSFSSKEDGIVRVDICEENSEKVITSGVTAVDADSENVKVEIDTENQEIPEHYVTKAVILDSKSETLCDEYVDEKNTEWYEKFSESKVSDFSTDRVINLDNKADDNFVVLKDDVTSISSDSSKNKLTEQNGGYVITNADDTVKSLSEGDVFCYNADDPDNIVIGQIEQINNSNSTVTIETKEPSSDDVFEMVKINYDNDKCLMEDDGVNSIDTSESGTAKKELTPVGENMSVTLTPYIKKSVGNVTAKLSTSLSLSCEYSLSKRFVSVSAKVTPSVDLTWEVKYKSSKTVNIGKIKIPTGIGGVTVNLGLKVKYDASASITASGHAEATAGYRWQYSKGKTSLTNLSKKPSFTSEIKVNGKFYIGLIISPTIGAFGVTEFGFDCNIGGSIQASASSNSNSTSTQQHLCKGCVDGVINLEISVDAVLRFQIVFVELEYKFHVYSTSFKIANFYYSPTFNNFGWGHCPYYSYKATFKIVDASGNPIRGAKVDGKTTGGDGKVCDFYKCGGHTIRISAAGYCTKDIDFGISGKTLTKTVKLKKGSSSIIERETDASYAAGKSYKYSNGSGSGYGGSGYATDYVEPLRYEEPAMGVILSTEYASSRRFDVAWIQRELNNLGYTCPVDGYYGNTTAAAVRQFQSDYSLISSGVCTLLTISMIKYPYKPVTAPSLSLTTATDIPSGGIATVKWNAVVGAANYDVYLYKTDGTLVNSMMNTTGSSASFVCYEEGEYIIKAVSENYRYTSGTAETAVIKVHNPSVVTFVDMDGTVLSKQLVEYGGSAKAPVTPETYGYTFSKWDKSFTNITADTVTINAIYNKNTYTVSFIDINGNVIDTQKVLYQESATPPTNFEVTSGYKFVGWDKDYKSIEGDTKIKTVLQWENEDLPIIIESCKAVRESECTGYTVTTDLRNYDKKRTNGRVVVALKTENDKFLSMTESSAFTLSASNSSEGQLSKKKVEVFVPYDGLAKKAEVYVVETYGQLIPISKSVRVPTDRTADWGPWVTEDQAPADYYDVSDARTEYRYRTKNIITSYSTSMAGYTQDGYSLVKSDSGTIDYVTRFPSGFSTNSYYYNLYNQKPVTASESATQKTVVNTNTIGYLYWHWCRGDNAGAGNRFISSCPEQNQYGSFYTFHAAFSSTPLTNPIYSDGYCYQWSNPSVCNSSYWWFGGDQYSAEQTIVQRCEYTTYSKLYNYYRWSDWSEWSATPLTNSDTVEVNTRNTKRYLTIDPTEDESGTQRTISGKLDASYVGKQLSLFIYKVDDASDYTNEYVGQTQISEDGSYEFVFKLREEPSEKTGDYTVAIGIEGTNTLMYLDSIEAPKPEYTVNLCDYDGTIIETQKVKAGDSAVISDKIPQRAGYTFVGWDYSNRGIYEDINIHAIYAPKIYTVVYIDWSNNLYEMKTYKYGERLVVPEIADTENTIAVGWDAIIDGVSTVTQNMVLTAKSENRRYTVTFYDFEGNVLDSQIIDYGEPAKIPDIESNEDYEFLGWDNSVDLGKITESVDVHPDFKFSKTTKIPQISVNTGIYSDTVTVEMNCNTENSIIYYSIDGGEEQEYTGPVTISSTSSVAYYASSLGYNNSDVQNATYIINRSGDENNFKYNVTVCTPDGETAGMFVADSGKLLPNDVINMTRDGYDLEGFYFDSALTQKCDTSVYCVNDTTVLFVNWAPKQYKVNFTYEDGTIIETQYVNYLEAASEPLPEEITIEDGYAFAGWSTDKYICVTEDMDVASVIKKQNEIVTLVISKKNYEIIEGLSYDLSAVVTGVKNPDLVWSSDDENIATVDQNGNVTAVSEGVAVITVRLTGTDYYAQCFITVTPDPLRSVCLVANSDYTLKNGLVFGVTVGKNHISEISEQFMNSGCKFTDKNGNELSSNDIAGTGTVIMLYNGIEQVDSAVLVIAGDINGDGAINNKDVSMLTRFLVDKESLGSGAIAAADVNADGVVNNRDASLLARYLVGKEKI